MNDARDTTVHDDAMLLLSLAQEDGNRIDPDRILRRRADAPSRVAFLLAMDQGWVDGEGWLTDAGRHAVEEWRR